MANAPAALDRYVQFAGASSKGTLPVRARHPRDRQGE
jgi:hypothetical protein